MSLLQKAYVPQILSELMSASEVLLQAFHLYSNKELVYRSNPNPAFGTDTLKSITHPNASKISAHSDKNGKVTMTPSTRKHSNCNKA